jgi:hypothetical protein
VRLGGAKALPAPSARACRPALGTDTKAWSESGQVFHTETVGFRSDVHTALVDLAATYTLPPLPEGAEPKIRAAAKRVIDGVMLSSGDVTPH